MTESSTLKGLLALPQELQEQIIEQLVSGFHIRACSVLERRLEGVSTANLRQLPWKIVAQHDILHAKLICKQMHRLCNTVESRYILSPHAEHFGGSCLLPNPDLLRTHDEETRYTTYSNHPTIRGIPMGLETLRTLLDQVRTFELPDDCSWQMGRRGYWMSSCETGPAGTAKLIERYPSLQNIVLGLGMTWFDNWSPMPCQIVDEYWIKKLSGRSAHGTVSDTIKEWLPDEDLPRLFIRFFVRHSHGSRNGNRYILILIFEAIRIPESSDDYRLRLVRKTCMVRQSTGASHAPCSQSETLSSRERGFVRKLMDETLSPLGRC